MLVSTSGPAFAGKVWTTVMLPRGQQPGKLLSLSSCYHTEPEKSSYIFTNEPTNVDSRTGEESAWYVESFMCQLAVGQLERKNLV